MGVYVCDCMLVGVCVCGCDFMRVPSLEDRNSDHGFLKTVGELSRAFSSLHPKCIRPYHVCLRVQTMCSV